MVLRFESHAEPVPGYRLLERIGSGGFGEVWKCEAPGGIFKAVKIIHGDLRSKDSDLVRYAEQELKALKRVKMVRHPYLLSLDRYDIVEGRLLIVMELADCNLWDRFRQCRIKGLPGIPRDELMVYMVETAEVLDLMNVEHQLLHLDIKPQNIFLQYNHVKVGDFGQVKDLEGVVASVTGGITPVYAAPETFDGIVTRFCDQYSLACVYQELLTGQRPFDGMSMQQLLMQHLASPPNLAPSPPSDRPALERALAKSPDNRWPSCKAFVQRLMQAEVVAAVNTNNTGNANVSRSGEVTNASTNLSANLMGSSARIEILPPSLTPPVALSVANSSTSGSSLNFGLPTMRDSGSAERMDRTPAPQQDLDPPLVAPAEQTGAGPIRPTLIIGLGAIGLRVLQRFRKLTTERFGVDGTPAIRTLFIDTDAETLQQAGQNRQAEGLASLRNEEIISAKLNRASHYMKPRLNGRSLLEGWFDPQLLHRLPRTPSTMGLRTLGRLALCDHYRTIIQKMIAELEICTNPSSIGETLANTHQDLRTNRPQVVIVSSLSGGTGSGMFLDLAYIARARLRKLGYSQPCVQACLFLPSDDPNEDCPPLQRANTYASLTELNHYSRPDSTYQSTFDERASLIRDNDAPFTSVAFFPAPSTVVPLTPSSGMHSRNTIRRGTQGDFKPPSGSKEIPAQRKQLSSDSTYTAADVLRLFLLGPVGRISEDARQIYEDKVIGIHGRMIGFIQHSWPRYSILERTARVLSGVVLEHWVSTDFNRARNKVPTWVTQKFEELSLSLNGLTGSLRRAADVAAGGAIEVKLAQAVDSLIPKKWIPRSPEPGVVLHAIDFITRIVGSPVGGISQTASADEAVRNALPSVIATAENELLAAVRGLVDDPQFRLAGSEEAVQQILADLNVNRSAMITRAEKAEAEARARYEILMNIAHPGRSNRKWNAAEVVENLRAFPTAQYRAIVERQAVQVYERLKVSVTGIQAQLASCRQGLQALQLEVVAQLERPSFAMNTRQLLPVGCATIEEASQKYLSVLSDDDLMQVERRVQSFLERTVGGLYQALLNSTDGTGYVFETLQRETQDYLNSRLGVVDLAGMFEQKYGPSMSRVMAQGYAEALPASIGSGPWQKSALTILGTPVGDAGEIVRQAADSGFPTEDRTLFCDTNDEVVIYREFPFVPLSVLPQLGPSWQMAYDTAPEVNQCSPHTRNDIGHWRGVDEQE